MTHALFREDFLISSLVKILNLRWNDEGCCPCLEYPNGKELSVEDFEFLPIKPTLELEMDEKMLCDGILFFGDGTIEFHDAEYKDAYCWEFFTEQSIEKVENYIKKLL